MKTYPLKLQRSSTRLLTLISALAGFAATQLAATDIQVTRMATNIVVSWPVVAADEYYLQVATDLAEPVAWSNATNATWTNGSACCSTIAITPDSQFYRLKAWDVLFDGTSTAAFRGYQQTTFPSNHWVVTANGELKTVAGSPTGHILTTNQYDDFELVWEWKTGPGGNSGVIYRATEFYDAPWKSAPEYQILDDGSASVPANQTSGAVYGLIAPTNKVLKPLGEWNQSRLLVLTNHVEHWLNGRKVVEFELDSAAFQSAVAASSFQAYSQFAKARTGHIAFQLWVPEVWFRNIKVRRWAAE